MSAANPIIQLRRKLRAFDALRYAGIFRLTRVTRIFESSAFGKIAHAARRSGRGPTRFLIPACYASVSCLLFYSGLVDFFFVSKGLAVMALHFSCSLQATRVGTGFAMKIKGLSCRQMRRAAHTYS
jgi:hypothetical protein